MHIAVLPLDERPVNSVLPAMVGAIAGADVEVAPADLLPAMRVPGDPDGLALWTEVVAAKSDALVVSLDMLGYGGLIASRTSHDKLDQVVRRLAVLDRIRGSRPDLPVSGVTTVMRASNSYNSGEEPGYWSEHGVELHGLGGALHRRFLGEGNDLAALRRAVPADVRHDFLQRRMRNHAVDLYCIGLAAAGTVEPVLVTADDTAERAAGTLEQLWLSGWTSALELDGPDGPVLSYPGADEVCAILTARALAARLDTPPSIAVVFPEAGGAGRVAPYENVPVEQTVANQVRAAGATLVADPADADAVLVVHAPAPDRADPVSAQGVPNGAAEAVVAAIAAQPVGTSIGLADVRYANGSDVPLVEGLLAGGLIDRLAAYGGWNTAGNTIGSVVAALVAGSAGRALGGYDAEAERRLLLHRLVEDYGYQAVVRTEIADRPEFNGHMSVPFDDADTATAYLRECGPRLSAILEAIGGAGWELTGMGLPWNRTFEIDFDVRKRAQ